MSPEERPPAAHDFRREDCPGFAEFYERVFCYVWHALARRGVATEADQKDLAQDIILAVYQKWPMYDPRRGTPEQWVHGFIVRRMAEYRRQQRRQTERRDALSDIHQDIADGVPGPEDRAMVDDERRSLYELFDEVDQDQLSVLIAKDIEGVPMEDIARAHAISLSTAYAWRDAARKDLEKAYRRKMGAAVLPVILADLFDADRTMREPPASARHEVWNRVHQAIGHGLPTAPAAAGAIEGARAALTGSRYASALAGAGLYLAGVATGGAIMYGYAVSSRSSPPIARNETAVAVPPAFASIASLPASIPQPTTVASTSAPPENSSSPVFMVASATARVSSSAPVRADTKFREEAEAWDVALAAFNRGDTDATLRALEGQSKEFHGGHFAQARERLSILALARAGRTSEARSKLEAIRQISPTSPLLKELDPLIPGKP